jgi:hypothetical protein
MHKQGNGKINKGFLDEKHTWEPQKRTLRNLSFQKEKMPLLKAAKLLALYLMASLTDSLLVIELV